MRNARATPLAVAGLAVVSLLWIATYAGTPYDDAYIYFRYARNFTAGLGPVFNVGERVEGYTGFLWFVLICLGTLFRLNPAVWSSILGLASYAGIVWLLLLFGNRRFGASRLRYLPAALFVLFPANGLWAVAGMETTLYSFLLLAALYLHLYGTGTRNAVRTGALLTLVSLARVEGIAFYVLVVAHDAVGRLKKRPDPRELRKLAPLAYGLGVFAVYLVGRRLYYGWWLPNTYYAKVGHEAAAYVRGLSYTLSFFETAFGCLLFGAAMLVHGLLYYRADRTWRLLLAVLMTGALLVTMGGGNNLPAWRYLVPFHPEAALLFAWFAGHAIETAPAKRRLAGMGIAAALLVVTVQAGISATVGNLHLVNFVANNRIFFRMARTSGRLFRKMLGPGDSIALNAMPIVAYFYEGRVWDMLGLVDTHIAHRNVPRGLRMHGHEKGDGAYILSKQPTLLILAGGPGVIPERVDTFPKPGTLFYLSDVEIGDNPLFRERYRPEQVALGRYYVNFFRLKTAERRPFDAKEFWEGEEPAFESRGINERLAATLLQKTTGLSGNPVGIFTQKLRALAPIPMVAL